MLEDSWSLLTIISELVDSVLYFAEHGFGSFSFGIFAAFTFAGFLLYFAWLSTDIPDVPEPPRPPYVIQIQGNVNSSRNGGGGGSRDSNRQTLSDVRLLSSGPIVDSVLHNLPQSSSRQHQHQHPNSTHSHHPTQHIQHSHGRQSALFFGFLRRPAPQPLIPLRPSSRSRFQSSNLVVYHQVNVFRANQNPSNNNVSSNSGSVSGGASGSGGVPSRIDSIQTTVVTANLRSVTVPESSSGSESGINERDRSLASSSTSSLVSDPRNCETSIPQFPGPSNSSFCEPSRRSNSSVNVRSSASDSETNNIPSSTRRSLRDDGELGFDSEVEEVEVELDEEDLDDMDLSASDSSGRTTVDVGVVDVSVNGDVRIVERDFSETCNLPSSSQQATSVSTSTSTCVHFQGDLNVTSKSNSSPNTATRTNVSMTRTTDVNNVIDNSKHENDQDKSRTTQSPVSTHTKPNSAPVPNSNNSPAECPPQNEPSQDVRITLKFLNDTQIEVTTQLTEKILDFKRRHFATELSENKIVRLIFNGRVLDNDVRTLQESGIFDHCVVHCLIVTPQASQQRGDGGGGAGNQSSPSSRSRLGRPLREGGPEPGMFFVSVLGIILIFLWFICFHFGQQLFTQSAVVSLVVLTAVFVIGLVALYLPVHSNNT